MTFANNNNFVSITANDIDILHTVDNEASDTVKSRKKRWICHIFPTGGVCLLYCTLYGYEVGECFPNEVCTCHKDSTTMLRAKLKILRQMTTTTVPPRAIPKRTSLNDDEMVDISTSVDWSDVWI